MWLVVDHDEVEPLSFDVPTLRDERLGVARVRLERERPGVPPACRPAAPPPTLGDAWPADAALPPGRLVDGVRRAAAGRRHPGRSTRRGCCCTSPRRCSRGRRRSCSPAGLQDHPMLGPRFQSLVHRLLADATAAVATLNAAARAHPAAGVAPLPMHPFLVELPLWKLAEGQPRGRVYADLADAEPWLVDERGDAARPRRRLARAAGAADDRADPRRTGRRAPASCTAPAVPPTTASPTTGGRRGRLGNRSPRSASPPRTSASASTPRSPAATTLPLPGGGPTRCRTTSTASPRSPPATAISWKRSACCSRR